jgi:hypothetical protein
MLTPDQIQANKMKYIDLLCKLGIDLTQLIEYLEAIDFFNKPGSLQYNKAYPGGLCEYALELHYELTRITGAYTKPGTYSEIDIIIVALFKDLYRAELYEAYNKNVKNEHTGQWESVPAYRNKEIRPVFGDIGFSSYMIIKRFIYLTDEQIEAICYSAFNKSYEVDIHNIRKMYPLVALTTMAEIAVTYISKN